MFKLHLHTIFNNPKRAKSFFDFKILFYPNLYLIRYFCEVFQYKS